MVGTKKPGAVAVWYRELREFKPGRSPRPSLPHLTLGATLVTFFVGAYLIVRFAEAAAIIVTRGPHAFFVDGLRVADWSTTGYRMAIFCPRPGS